jgi:hypothetical protein
MATHRLADDLPRVPVIGHLLPLAVLLHLPAGVEDTVIANEARGLNDLLADDVVFYSPVAYTAQRDREVTTRFLSAALRVFFNPSLRCVRKIVGPSDGLFEFETQIDGILVNALDLLTWNSDGRVVEFEVMVRPLKAINLTQQKMAAILVSTQVNATLGLD